MSPVEPGEAAGAAASAVGMLASPCVAVVMPVHNAAATLDATVTSALAQTFHPFELIAIDDGSTDDSLARLLALAGRDVRIKVISRSNAGVSSARNLGVSATSAPLIAFLDADDLWHPEKLARHVACHLDQPAIGASYGRIAFIAPHATGLAGAKTQSKIIPRPLRSLDILGENPICTASNLMVRRDWFVAAGGFDVALSYAEDQELGARLIAQGAEIVGIDEVLTGYRLSPGGLSMDLERMYAAWRLIAARHLSPGEIAPLEALYCRYLTRRVLRGGGRPGMALRYALAGLSHDAGSFLAQRRRGLSTLAAALAAPLLPAPARRWIFA